MSALNFTNYILKYKLLIYVTNLNQHKKQWSILNKTVPKA